MKRITYLVISVTLIILMFILGSEIKENSSVSSNNTSVQARVQSSETVTDPLYFIAHDETGAVISDINLIIIDSNGKTVGITKTGKDGTADITVTVPVDKRYDSDIGTVTVIGYNNDKYRRTVLLEVPVAGGGVMNQDLTMLLKTGYRDEEINVCYGNIYHMFSMDMVNKYIPWNGK